MSIDTTDEGTGSTLDDLRSALFATLRRLQDKAQPIEIEQAAATVQVAQALIATGKLEIEYLKLTKKDDEVPESQFLASIRDRSEIGSSRTQPAITSANLRSGKETISHVSGGRIVQHRII